MLVTEVDAEHQPGRAVERDHHRGPAGVGLLRSRVLGIAFDRQAGAEQVADDRRDGRAREARDPSQLGPACHAALAQRVDNPLAVALAQRRQ
jgi:hypothetical protein